MVRLELERSRLDFEKSAGDYLKGKESSFKRQSDVVQSEQMRVQRENDALLLTLRKYV